MINCRSCWATNWNLQGNAALAEPGVLPETETTRNAVGGQPSPFADPTAALEAFRNLYPGEAGIRNLLRGDGYFTIDLSIAKAFRLPATQRLEFRWDIFNLTNTPKFDTGDVTMFPDSAASFGRYDSSLAACDGAAGRCMQLNLRYTFYRTGRCLLAAGPSGPPRAAFESSRRWARRRTAATARSRWVALARPGTAWRGRGRRRSRSCRSRT